MRGRHSLRPIVTVVVVAAVVGPARSAASASSGAPHLPAGAVRGTGQSSVSEPVAFRDATETSGLSTWATRYGHPTDKATILETMGPGVGIVDIDADGFLDLYVVSGPSGNMLFRNRSDSTFSPVPANAGTGLDGWYFGIAAADFDNDGLLDLYLTAFGDNNLLRNNGDGTFTDVTDAADATHSGWSTGAGWADFDGDGWVDLLVVNYVKLDLATVPEPGSGPFCTWKHLPVPCGPRGMEGDRAMLFRNAGDGGFQRVQRDTFAGGDYYGLGVVWSDFDSDGFIDVYVADDQTPNRFFHNRAGTFVEVGSITGSAFNEDGRSEAGMGVDAGDFDGDGSTDLFVTNFADESNTLYQNVGGELFVDATVAARLALPSFRYLAWGTAFQDFDSDGDSDLFVANGHVYPQVDTYELVDPYPQENQLFVNEGGVFSAWEAATGDGLGIARVSRGAAFGDIDRDGDVDVLVGNVDAPPQLLMNGLVQGSWIRVRLLGRRSNRAAIGARVRVRHADGEAVAEVKAGNSYLSQSSMTLHFGLGSADSADIEIRWPRSGDDATETLAGIVSGTTLVVIEGRGQLPVRRR